MRKSSVVIAHILLEPYVLETRDFVLSGLRNTKELEKTRPLGSRLLDSNDYRCLEGDIGFRRDRSS